jgi:D-3-phosphoglycerate dehydrogenase
MGENVAFLVYIPQEVSETGRHYLKENGCEILGGSGIDEETLIGESSGCDAILVRTAKITARVIDANARLKVIGRHGIGVENIDVNYAEKKGIWVTNGPASNNNSVAEAAIMLMLMCARNTYAVETIFRGDGDFDVRNRFHGYDLEGKTLGLIGLGKIGTLTAKKAAHGFGMKVIGYDMFVPREKVDMCIEFINSREEVFQKADFLSIHIPALPGTVGSVTMNDFKMMKKTAYFINCARGEIVKEADLVQALQEGIIAGAGLDVYCPEPPEATNPLLKMPNVIATPHNSAHTKESLDRMSLHAAMGIIDVLTDKIPMWPVNRPASPRKISD